jgi:hypothetical protein
MTRPIRSFTDLLPLLSRGRFVERLDEHLGHALATLEALPTESGRATLTVTLTIAYEAGRLDITPSVKSKLPEDKGFSGTPFWALEGALSIQHPSQIDMFSGPKPVAVAVAPAVEGGTR